MVRAANRRYYYLKGKPENHLTLCHSADYVVDSDEDHTNNCPQKYKVDPDFVFEGRGEAVFDLALVRRQVFKQERLLFAGVPHEESGDHILDAGTCVRANNSNQDLQIVRHHGQKNGRNGGQ